MLPTWVRPASELLSLGKLLEFFIYLIVETLFI
jgi:hypothetical protein